MVRLGTAVALSLLAATSTFATASPGRDQNVSSASPSSSTAPLAGTWRRLTTCAELVAALKKAGMQK